TCVVVDTPETVTADDPLGYNLEATASVGGSNVTSEITAYFYVVASLTDSTTLAVVNSEQSGRLRTVLTEANQFNVVGGFSTSPFSEPGVAFNSIVSACALAPDSPPLPGGLTLHVSSDLRACVIGVGAEASRIVTDIAEYTIIGSRGDIGSSDFQSATGTLRLEVVAGDFTTPVLSISHGAAGVANTVILNPSTPVAIPFANTGSKLSSLFVDTCKVTGTLPTGLTVRLATEADKRPGITEGSTCMLVGTPGATAVDAVNVTISYPNTRATSGNANPPDATVQFSIQIAQTPVLVPPDRPIIMERNNVYTAAEPAATLANTGMTIDSCAIEFVPRTDKFGQAHTPLISDTTNPLAAEVSGGACVITGAVTGKTFSSTELQAIYRVTATADGVSGGADRTSTAEIKMSFFDSNPIRPSTSSNVLHTVYTDQTFGTRGNGFPGRNFFGFGLAVNFLRSVSSCDLGDGSPPLPGGMSLHVRSDRTACILYVDPDKSLRVPSPPTDYPIVVRSGAQNSSGTLRLEVIDGSYVRPALSIAHPAGSPTNTVVIETDSFVTIPFTNTGGKISSHLEVYSDGCRGKFSDGDLLLPDFSRSGLTVRVATQADEEAGHGVEGSTCILSGTVTDLLAPTAFNLLYAVVSNDGNPNGFYEAELSFTLSVVAPQ
ncbi:MAG: hypothetical protein K8963_04920, partial [Proteobacteria bacterium]|nr:hypothetical protein [Pseudomonadota bacterium]